MALVSEFDEIANPFTLRRLQHLWFQYLFIWERTLGRICKFS